MKYYLEFPWFLISQINDETDEDLLGVLLDPAAPFGCQMLTGINPSRYTGCYSDSRVEFLLASRRLRPPAKFSASSTGNLQLGSIFHEVFASLCYKIRNLSPWALCNLKTDINVEEDDSVEIVVSATAIQLDPKIVKSSERHLKQALLLPAATRPREIFKRPSVRNTDPELAEGERQLGLFASASRESFHRIFQPLLFVAGVGVTITSCSYVPGKTIAQYLGPVHLIFIREKLSHKDSGNSAQEFSHLFMNEVSAIVRSRVASRGGNGLIGYELSRFTISESKYHQLYGIITVQGDVVRLIPEVKKNDAAPPIQGCMEEKGVDNMV